MSKGNGSGYRRMVARQYRDLMDHCERNLKKVEDTLPEPRENLRELMEDRGITRRDFVKWTSMMTAALMLPPVFRPALARAAENFGRLPVVWMHFAECTGCSIAFLRSSYPNVDSILLETISLEYHETLMAASGDQAEECLEKAMKDFPGQYLCVIEGAVPTGLYGRYLTIGPHGHTGLQIAKKVTSKAGAVMCIGSCACDGGVQSASPNPTLSFGVGKALRIPTVNIAGCPPNSVNFTGTILHYLMFGSMPPLDSLGRPVWAYGKRVHDFCERRPHYDAGEYVEEWGDRGALNGWCLYKVGCKGPYAFANCGRVRFNDGISWPVMAGHGCIGCTEPGFWDTMAPLTKPISEKTLFGGERTVDRIGIALTGVTVAGIAAHAAASAIRHRSDNSPKGSDGEEGNE